MLTKEQKIKFVEEGKKALDAYKVIGVVELDYIPDRLLQSSRNSMREKVRFMTGRKNFMEMILESSERTKPLVKELKGTSAILLSNEDPFELNKLFKSKSLKLAAKTKQIAPEDIVISAGETSLQPGQAVTELKSAGIDVKMDKGKVLIAKDKVLVAKGSQISLSIAKALHTLEVMPFTAYIAPKALLSGGLIFRQDALSMNAEQLSKDIAHAFAEALELSFKAKIVNKYTIKKLVTDAYLSALHVGVEAKLYDSGIIDKLLANAVLQASTINNIVPE